ncbi:bifunctional helix-turn-helix transcriptional regulator/GNAT family N-acetyltransferase [Saccharothrix sp. 6-C]|uniref:bifunctional helix-turn-helix transcriptional regulator/GNAT family N-acetyltransferase n=1 Tax=Saccharothrix sp. 6-C TaxID=2781735 RepID=UPI0019171BF3|nr:bifunctional helix-turn-helix transcriptional regulator/GNAT family N-acetyltransferase [Saccharothrix sp. 6-C]QQQ79020.1 bifunctional helix-turn-helix transcriptional regulator/GNAT family N-acetyltransferase [Saccharothrix sp. 6-C]
MTVADVRAFNRFYTGVIGVLDRGYLASPYSLTEVRVLFELASGAREAADLRAALALDAGYLSRILTSFDRAGLVTRTASERDARRHVVALTPRGESVFADLDARSDAGIGALLDRVAPADRAELAAAMRKIERLLTGTPRAYLLRPLRPGDLGWVVNRHGVRYAEECGFDQTFEALVARVAGEYGERHRPDREAAWIAEVDGEPVGSIFCTRVDDRTAKLRLLLVEPAARGLGIGARLVEECLRFARRAGYERMELWTVAGLAASRHLYEKAGFRVDRSTPERLFGCDVEAQTWSLEL